MDIRTAAQSALHANIEQLASAGSAAAVEELVPDIVREIEDTYKPQNDAFAFRAVILVLGAVVLVVVITYAWYTMAPPVRANAIPPLPDALIALGSAAVGALAGILAPSPRG